jgi:hypothetical protein
LATPAFFFSLIMKYSCLPDHSSQGVITRVSTYLAAQIRRTTSLAICWAVTFAIWRSSPLTIFLCSWPAACGCCLGKSGHGGRGSS